MPSSIPHLDFTDCLACEYVPNWAALTTIALAMVGVAPRHNVKTPSSFLKYHLSYQRKL